MRFKEKIDQILWGIIYGLPVIAYLVSLLTEVTPFATYVNTFIDGSFFGTASDFFTQYGWVIPSSMWAIASWIALAHVVHIMLDLVLFVPTYGQKLLSRWFGGVTNG